VNAFQGRPRPAIWGPVLIAAIFLAIIGGSAGWIAGGWAKAPDEREAAENQYQDPPPGDDPTAGNGNGGDGDGGNGGNEAGNGTSGGDRPAADRCPAHTRQLAAKNGAVGKLTVKFYLRTTRSHVWICADENGTLFYQGFRGRLSGAQLVEGPNALFLTAVSEDDDGCVAVNKDGDEVTTYRVTSDRLVITHPDGKESVERAA
jgi:hypothetical protein